MYRAGIYGSLLRPFASNLRITHYASSSTVFGQRVFVARRGVKRLSRISNLPKLCITSSSSNHVSESFLLIILPSFIYSYIYINLKALLYSSVNILYVHNNNNRITAELFYHSGQSPEKSFAEKLSRYTLTN